MKKFISAKPIWLSGNANEMNIQAAFTADLLWEEDTKEDICISITGATLYKLWVNEAYVGYGPARAAHGYCRIDRWKVNQYLREGNNTIRVEAAGYNCPSYYTIKNASFVQAEVTADEKVLLYTGRDFSGERVNERVQKVMRYSFQRAFSEVWDYRVKNTGMDVEEVEPRLQYLERSAPYPDGTIYTTKEDGIKGTFTYQTNNNLKKDRYITEISDIFPGFKENEITEKPYYELQKMQFVDTGVHTSIKNHVIDAGEYLLVDMGQNRTGFLISELESLAACQYMIIFDEKLTDGVINFRNIDMINMVDYKVPKGKWRNETFEVYGFRYAMIIVLQGTLKLDHLSVRGYTYPVINTKIETEDKELKKLYHAAVETFRQNAVDVYMDCPTRERAGWLCDSYYTAKSEYAFTGDNQLERCFVENYQLYQKVKELPEGMLPMCYPSEHTDGNYIPQWAMWFIRELDDMQQRSQMLDMQQFHTLSYKLLQFFKPYENEDGLLERLPKWNFVEWSKANDWVFDVNYPTNMLYSNICGIIGNWYNDSELISKSERLKNKIIHLSFNGELFVDHAVRDKENKLQNENDISEVCQYYAIRFLGLDMTDEKYSKLLHMVLNTFSMVEEKRNYENQIEPANAFMGNYLRMEVLYKWGRYDLLLDEIKGGFMHMVDDTGTLWENSKKVGSLNHGFASYIGVLIKEIVEKRK